MAEAAPVSPLAPNRKEWVAKPSHATVDMNPNNRLRTYGLCAVLCLSGLAARAQELKRNTATFHHAGGGEDADTLMAKGDEFDKRLQAKEALEAYLPANKLNPDNVDLLVRIARQYRHLMADAPAKNEKLRLGAVSLEFANRAARLAPNNAEAQLSPAISYGKMLPFMGSKDQVMAAPRIKTSVDRALQLDPTNDNAWHILGRWNRVLADINPVKRALAKALFGGLPVTTNEAAEKCLLKAIEINPNRLIHYIELGHVYVQMGRKEDARKYIKKGLAIPDKEKDDPEMRDVGVQLLEKL